VQLLVLPAGMSEREYCFGLLPLLDAGRTRAVLSAIGESVGGRSRLPRCIGNDASASDGFA